MTEDIEKLRALASKAGSAYEGQPFRQSDNITVRDDDAAADDGPFAVVGNDQGWMWDCVCEGVAPRGLAVFIASTFDDVPTLCDAVRTLCDEIDRLRAENARLVGELKEVRSNLAEHISASAELAEVAGRLVPDLCNEVFMLRAKVTP